MNAYFRNLAALTSISLLLLSGCQNPTDQSGLSSGSNTPPVKNVRFSQGYDPCVLLTAEDAATAFPGVKIDLNQHDTVPDIVGMKTCNYSVSENTAKFIRLSVISDATIPAEIRDNGTDVISLFNGEKKLATDPQDMPGLGDEAFYGGNGRRAVAGMNVLVKSKQTKFNLEVGLGLGNNDAQAHIDMEKELSAKVLGRL